jgi:uncharacterized protein (DUF1330 family)
VLYQLSYSGAALIVSAARHEPCIVAASCRLARRREPMSAFIVARVDVRDRERYAEYMLHTPRVIARHGGRFVARGGERVILEGEDDGLRLVLIEFPSLDDAQAFYHSQDYQAAKLLREGAGDAQVIAVDGYPAQEWEAARAASEQLG